MSKLLWTSQEAAKATAGRAIGDWAVSGLSIDSRSIQAGEMFVPLKDTRDGHDFIGGARANGASAIMSEHQTEAAPALVVTNAMQALTDLAVASRIRSKAKRIGVTGSVAKTSVKEALAHMFEGFGATHKSIKSYNNHWGVPLTLANMPAETEYGVFEMGMTHAGELTQLSDIVRPDVAIITTVAPAHLAHFENVEAIAQAKAEIMQGLVPGGLLILNADNEYTPQIMAQAKDNEIQCSTFGQSEISDVKVMSSELRADGSLIHLKIGKTDVSVNLPIPGEHWVINVAACMATAQACELDLHKAAKAFESFGAVAGRGEIHALTIDGKSVTLIDDSYNANPTSMAAAISVLAAQKGRKIAVLGDMFELGKDELAMHAELSKPLEAGNVSRVIVTGECMRALRGSLPLPMRGAWTANWKAALEALIMEIETEDVILVKGSNGVGLSHLVSAMKAKGRLHAL